MLSPQNLCCGADFDVKATTLLEVDENLQTCYDKMSTSDIDMWPNTNSAQTEAWRSAL